MYFSTKYNTDLEFIMELFKEFVLQESQKSAMLEVKHNISVINNIYNEWKKTGRRVNAVSLVTMSANKLATISPESIDKLPEDAKLRAATILMRCFDLPPWQNIENKKSIYKKLQPLLNKLHSHNINTGTGGTLREIVQTRLSACLSNKSEKGVFVAYEPSITASYLKYLFNTEKPKKVFKMQALSFPTDFESLVDRLKINQEKAESKFKPK